MKDAIAHFGLKLTEDDFEQIYKDVKDSAAEVIKNKGQCHGFRYFVHSMID